MEDVKVPQMGESISQAIVGTLIKPTGSMVAVDDELMELETDKVNQVIYATTSGVVTWQVEVGDTVDIGQVLGTIDPSNVGKAATLDEEVKQVEKLPEVKGSSPSAVQGIRKTEQEFAQSLQLPVEEKVASKKDLPRNESRSKMPRIRQVIAQRLLHAVKTTAMLTTFNEVDMTQVIQIRTKHKVTFAEEHGVKLGFMSFFVKAVLSALFKFPAFNTYIDGEDLVRRHYLDIGIAVGTEKGLVVPVIRNADTLDFAGIESAILRYAKQAHEGKLSADDLVGGSFTITNGGVYGSMLSTPILNPPQCGILGMHNIQKRAVVVEDRVEIRPIMYLALSYDHRVIDGKEAVSFLLHIKNEIEDPSRLILDI